MIFNSTNNFLTTIEARMTSSRLPGKVMLNLENQDTKKRATVLEILIKRIKKSKYIKDIVIATTNKSTDDPIIKIAKKYKIIFFRGDENNVLERLFKATKNYNHKNIIQLTGDNPLIDPKVIDYLVKFYIKNYSKYDFVSNNNLFQIKKKKIPDGMTVSIFKKKSLNTVFLKAKKKIFQEHPSLYFYTEGKKIFKIKNVNIPKYWHNNLNLRLTLDTPHDYFFLRIIYNNLKKKKYFGLTEIINFVKKNRNLLLINKNIKQRIPKNINL